MAKHIFLILAAFVVSASAFGDETTRETAIKRIEASWADVQLLSDNSPLGDLLVDMYRKANPEVNDEKWLPIKKQILAECATTLFAKGGAMDVLIRKTLESFSDAEVERLTLLVNDPVFKKYQIASASPAVQKQHMQEMARFALNMGVIANKILAQNGLRQVH